MSNIQTYIRTFGKKFFGQVQGRSATRDWALVLGVGAIVFVFCFSYAAYLYLGARSGFLYTAEDQGGEPVPEISYNRLSDLISLFETRAINYESGNIRRPEVSDPR